MSRDMVRRGRNSVNTTTAAWVILPSGRSAAMTSLDCIDDLRRGSIFEHLAEMRLSGPMFRSLFPLLLAAGVLVALLPWWRNHGYLRDFYDYGLFIKVNARLDAGQKPWTDFTTPAQSASFLGNYVAEKLGGGTYRGMTYGAAALIIASLLALGTLLVRRGSPGAAALVATAIVVCSASQHTILFYNPMGVLALALVSWSFAFAPVLRRKTWGWHLAAGVGLVLGGLNKINFHLLGCGMAVGWLLWATVQRRATWRDLAAGLGFVVVAGGVVPVALELIWSGAGWRTWFYNILQLPLQARGGRLELLADAKLYFHTLHDYYGPLRLPQAGAIVLGLPLVAGVFAWWSGRRAGLWRAVFAVGAGIGAGLGGALLLLTNNEIVFLSLAASLVLAVSIWLGFGLEFKGAGFAAVILVPALVCAATGWESAWQGQRSQFGHAGDPRADYVDGGTLGAEFAYLRGTRVPPGWGESLRHAAQWRLDLPESERDAIYIGPGLEWLERVWPVRLERGLPLVLAGFDGEREVGAVERLLTGPGGLPHFLVVEAWDYLPPRLAELMRLRFEKERLGTAFFGYSRLPGHVLGRRSVHMPSEIGGNVDPALVATQMPAQQLADGRRFRGVTGGQGSLDLLARHNRSSAEAVVRRAPGAPRTAAVARFRVQAVNGEARYDRWSAEIALPADADEVVLRTPSIDASALPASYVVEAPEGLIAGWRDLRLSDSTTIAGPPPRVADVSTSARIAGPEFAEHLHGGRMPPTEVWGRQALLRDGVCLLAPGGEAWIQLRGLYSRIEIVTRAIAGGDGQLRTRVLYYKGGRMEHFYPEPGSESGIRRYRFWSPENDGWLAIINPDGVGTGVVGIEITAAEPSN